jgi:hypothetical protein
VVVIAADAEVVRFYYRSAAIFGVNTLGTTEENNSLTFGGCCCCAVSILAERLCNVYQPATSMFLLTARSSDTQGAPNKRLPWHRDIPCHMQRPVSIGALCVGWIPEFECGAVMIIL